MKRFFFKPLEKDGSSEKTCPSPSPAAAAVAASDTNADAPGPTGGPLTWNANSLLLRIKNNWPLFSKSGQTLDSDGVSVQAKMEEKPADFEAELSTGDVSLATAPSPEAISSGIATLTLDENPQEKPEEISDQDGIWAGDWYAILEEDQEEEPEASKEAKDAKLRYPVRHGKPDRACYLKTGNCRFGSNSKLNHPKRWKRNLAAKEKEKEAEKKTQSEKAGQIRCKAAKEKEKEAEKKTQSEKAGQIRCKYYLTPGGCKFHKECKFVHDNEMHKGPAEVNFLGLPMRPGKKECPYYMRTGGCKYGDNCRFHHPDPIAVGEPNLPLQYIPAHGPGVAQVPTTSWPLQIASNEPVTFLNASSPFNPQIVVPPQGLHSTPEWNGYQAPINPSYSPLTPPPDTIIQHNSASAMHDQKNKVHGSIHQQVPTHGDEYPERPGQPDCQYFLKSGSCKFKSSCWFHHPKGLPAKASPNVVKPHAA